MAIKETGKCAEDIALVHGRTICPEVREEKRAAVQAAAPYLTDEARAGSLRWAANFKDASLRLDPISPAASIDSLASAGRGGPRRHGGGGGGYGGGNGGGRGGYGGGNGGGGGRGFGR